MSVLIPLAFGLALAGRPSVPAVRAVETTALSAPSHPRTPQWARPAASVAPVLCRARLSRRAGVSRIERALTSLGARTVVSPSRAWSGLAVSGARAALSLRGVVIFERGPPLLS
jgi:hypothetical protein